MIGCSEPLSDTQLALAMPAWEGIRSRLVAYARESCGAEPQPRKLPEMEGVGGSDGSREANK